MPLFLFGLMGDGSGGADVWIKPRLFHGRCCLPQFLFSEASVEFAWDFSSGAQGSGAGARAPWGALSVSRGGGGDSLVSWPAGWENTAAVCSSCVVPAAGSKSTYPYNVCTVPALPAGNGATRRAMLPPAPTVGKRRNPKEKDLLLLSITMQSPWSGSWLFYREGCQG